MVTYGLRQILMDKQTLENYENNVQVCWDDIKRRLLLCEHSINPQIPDHFIQAAIEHYNIRSLSDLLTNGLSSLANEYIEPKGDKLYIKQVKFYLWQESLTLCPPLVLIAAYLWGIRKIKSRYSIEQYVIKNARYTAILAPYIEELEDIKSKGGFNDLHIHLNGSTETDIVWQDILNQPNKLRKEYRKAFSKDLVKEQNEQECIFKDSNHLYILLDRARALRYYIVNILKGREDGYPNVDFKVNYYTQNIEKGKHPFNDDPNLTCLQVECLMYINIIEYLSTNKEHESLLAKAFHHYLLILGSINRFTVQQIHQKGFRQFQKISDNDLRSISEKNYANRFFQLYGNDNQSNFKIIEGRFAPKMTPCEIDSLISKIRSGWESFNIEKTKDKRLELRLISHFIKSKGSYDEFYRHEKLRNKLWIQANAILSLKNDKDWMKSPEESTEVNAKINFNKLVGIDAAASEFNAPPEVFAPVFRFLRKKSGINHFTFHAGEDFFHIVSGLRAIYETIEFLDLQKGDRVGHATALGINPQLWKERIGETIYISQGEWLDNLIFISHLVNIQPSNLCDKINEEIEKLSIEIYGTNYSFDDLKSAWLNKKWDPEILLSNTFVEAEQKRVGCLHEWNEISKSNISPTVRNIIRQYHIQKKSYDKKIVVNHDVICIELIEQIQKMTLDIIIKNEIVIETLPTSNVRIGIYNNHKEHHLQKWINENIVTNIPKIVVGSDDTGIFATNIYNEYAHIYLLYQQNQLNIIQMLNDNSNNYFFKE